MVAGGDTGDGFSGAGDVFIFCGNVFHTGDSADVGDEIAVALVAAGGGEVVFRLGGEQGHQRIDERGLAAAGGADNGGAFAVDLCEVFSRETAPSCKLLTR